MSTGVSARRGRVSRLSWLGPILLLASGVGVFALVAMTVLAANNLVVSLANRPRAIDEFRAPLRMLEAHRQLPARREVAIAAVAPRDHIDDLYRRAGASEGDDRLLDLQNKLAEAPLMFDAERSAWRRRPLQAGAGTVGGDDLLATSSDGPAFLSDDRRWDLAFAKDEPAVAAPETPQVAVVETKPEAEQVAIVEPRLAPAPQPVQVAQIPLPPVAPAMVAPVVVAETVVRVTPIPTPRPADFARMAQERSRLPIVPVKLESATDAAAAPRPAALAYANAEIEPKRTGVGEFFNNLLDNGVRAQLPSHGSGVAVYDITSATVRLPNGERLEAHSGLGHRQDNPAYVREKNRGPTPPNVYDLRLREALFHGAQAIRLTPRYQAKVFNRDGLLAHPYMYVGGGGRQQSNGCVVFKNYERFLRAFKAGEVRHLVVVRDMSELPTSMAGL